MLGLALGFIGVGYGIIHWRMRAYNEYYKTLRDRKVRHTSLDTDDSEETPVHDNGGIDQL